MKKIFVFAVALVATTTSFGQNNSQEATEMTNKLITDLSLTAEQTQRVSDIYQNIAIKNEAVLNDPNATEQFKADALKGNTDAGKDLVMQVLTEEQKAKWNASTAPRRAKVQNTPVKVQERPAEKKSN